MIWWVLHSGSAKARGLVRNSSLLVPVPVLLKKFNQAKLFAVDPDEPTVPEGRCTSGARDAMETRGSALLERFVEVCNFITKVQQLEAVAQAPGDGRTVAKWFEEFNGDSVKFDESEGNSLGLFHERLAGRANRLDGFYSQTHMVKVGVVSKYSAMNGGALPILHEFYLCLLRSNRSMHRSGEL